MRHDISWESSAGRRFSCNIIPYFFLKIGKSDAKFVDYCSRDWRFKGLTNCLSYLLKCVPLNFQLHINEFFYIIYISLICVLKLHTSNDTINAIVLLSSWPNFIIYIIYFNVIPLLLPSPHPSLKNNCTSFFSTMCTQAMRLKSL